MPEALSPAPESGSSPSSAEVPNQAETNLRFTNPDAAYEWYKRLGPSELDPALAGDLIQAGRTALGSTPELRHKDDARSYERHLDRQLSGACMLIEAVGLLEDESRPQTELEQVATDALEAMTKPNAAGKSPAIREADEWYAMQAGMYLANLQDQQARRSGQPANHSVTHLANLANQLPAYLEHHPKAEQDIIGLRTEMAVYLLLDNWARAMKAADVSLSVRKAFPREDAPHDGKRRQDRRSVDVVVSRHNPDGSYDRYLIQDKTANAHGEARTNEDMGYNANVILVWLRAADAESILSTYGDIARRRDVDPRRQEFIRESRAKVIRESGLGELIRY